MIDALILILLGLVSILVVVHYFLKVRELSKTGVKTEGIVFDTESEQMSGVASQYPIIRFTTQNEEWITEKYMIGIIPGMVKKGKKVQVIYNPEKPSEFIVQSPIFTPVFILMASVGLVFLGVGIFKLFVIEP